MFGMVTGVTPLPEAPALKREFVVFKLEVLVFLSFKSIREGLFGF